MDPASMKENTAPSIAIPLALGFWSAVVITIFNVLSSLMMIPSWFTNPILPWRGIDTYASTFHFFQIASMIPGFLVVLPFLPMMAAVHYVSPPDRRVLSMLGIAFAAVSVGIYQGVPVLDLDYAEDSACDTDMNVVMLGNGRFVEVQGTAEGHAFSPAEMDAMMALAQSGIAELIAIQRVALES